MPTCVCQPVQWKNRPGYRLSNGTVDLVVLLGGGHLADFRQSGSDVNVLWEAPWPTIDPQSFSPEHEALYGSGPAARLLCGFTGHSLALGYFGTPTQQEAALGLPLHGEASTAQWTVSSHDESDNAARLVLTATLPVYRLEVRREFLLRASAYNVHINETVANHSPSSTNIQWVQHTDFGPPFFSAEAATLHLAAERSKTWPLGYENAPLLQSDVEFSWPNAPTIDHQTLDLSIPFQHRGKGFIACVLLDRHQSHSAVLVHNRPLSYIAGYVFERERFPWLTLWEENCARPDVPWSGRTQARGLEFGNTPFPLGLAWAERTREMFDTPVFTTLTPGQSVQTAYHVFLSQVPEQWNTITDLRASRDRLTVRCIADELILDLNP